MYWSAISGFTGSVGRAGLSDESQGRSCVSIYSGPVSWASRLTIAGVNWQFPVLSIAHDGSGRRLVSSGFGFLPDNPERGFRSLKAWSAC